MFFFFYCIVCCCSVFFARQVSCLFLFSSVFGVAAAMCLHFSLFLFLLFLYCVCCVGEQMLPSLFFFKYELFCFFFFNAVWLLFISFPFFFLGFFNSCSLLFFLRPALMFVPHSSSAKRRASPVAFILWFHFSSFFYICYIVKTLLRPQNRLSFFL